MQNFLSNFTQYPSSATTLLLYIMVCLLLTFTLTALFCPTTSQKNINFFATINNLDFFKIILTYCVLLHHELQVLGQENEGLYGVEGFFIISGFLLKYTYSAFAKNEIKDFILKKLINFIPYIFLGNMLALFAYNDFNVLKFFSGIFMFASTGFYPEHTYYGPAWYLIVLFWISLLYFILFKTLKKDICDIIISIITFLTLFSTHNDISPISIPIEGISKEIPIFTNAFVRGFVGMGLGYFLAESYQTSEANKNNSQFMYNLFELALLSYMILAFFTDEYSMPYVTVLISYLILFWSAINCKSYLFAKLEKIKWHRFAKYNIAIYMTHWSICQFQSRLGLWDEYTIFEKIILTLVSSIILGVISYWTIRFGQYFSKKLHTKICSTKQQ